MTDKLLGSMDIAALVAAAEGAKEAASELLPVFNGEGKQLGLAPRILCHRLGLIHKAVFCFIGAPDGRLLLQHRKNGRLDVAVGGHMSSDDKSIEDALVREIREETGLQMSRNRLAKIAEYFRDCTDRLSKPRDMNRELRTLFFVELSDEECDVLGQRFQERQDRAAVLAIEWFHLDAVLNACDSDVAADGLAASISHYLLWRSRDV